MKRVIIQNRSFWTQSFQDTLKDLVQGDFEDRNLEAESTTCLSKTERDIAEYDLIIAHPHIIPNDCCLPYLKRARENRIPIVIVYSTVGSKREMLEAMSDDFDARSIAELGANYNFYVNLIRKSRILE